MMPGGVPEIYPEELSRLISEGRSPLLLDIREEEERDISKLEPDLHIAMAEIPSRLGELDRDADIVVYCRSGNRSGRVVAYMRQRGFKHVRNLATGINGWAQTVDPSLPQY